MEGKSRSQICYITTNKFLQVFTNFFLQDSISKVGPAASSNTPCLLWHMVPDNKNEREGGGGGVKIKMVSFWLVILEKLHTL